MISSAWLEKYKPELPEDKENNKLLSDSLTENTCKHDSVHILSDEQISIAEDKSFSSENNTLSTTGQSVVSCISENDKEISQNAVTVQGRNREKNCSEIKFMTNNLESVKEYSCKMDDKPVTDATSMSKQSEEKKYPNEDVHVKVSDSCEAQSKSRTRGSVRVADPVLSSELREDTESAFIKDSRDSPKDIMRNKRKVDRETTELEKPHKKFRCEIDNEEEICEERKG